MNHQDLDLDFLTRTGDNSGKPSVYIKEVKDDKRIETIEMTKELVELLVSEPKCSAWKSDYSASLDQNLPPQSLPKKAQNITAAYSHEKSPQGRKKKSFCLDLPPAGLSKPMKATESKIYSKQPLSKSVNPASIRTRKRKRTWSKKSKMLSPERAGLCVRSVDDVDDAGWRSKEKQLSHSCQTNKNYKDSHRLNGGDNKESCQRCMAGRGEISDIVSTAGSENLNQSCLPSCHKSEKTGGHTESHARGKQNTRTLTNKGCVQYSNETLSDTSWKCAERELMKKGRCRKKNDRTYSKTELKRQNIPASQLAGNKIPSSLTRAQVRSVQELKTSATVEPKPKRKVSIKHFRCSCCDAFPLKVTKKRRKDVEVSARLNQNVSSRITQKKRKRRKVKLKLASPVRHATPEEVKLANSLIFEISKDMGLLSEECGKETCWSLQSTKDSYMKETNTSSKQDNMLSGGRQCFTDKVISPSDKHLNVVDIDTDGMENENHSPSLILDTVNPDDTSIISKPIPEQKSLKSSTNLSKSFTKYPLQVQEIPTSSGVRKSQLRGDLQFPTYSVANEKFCDNSEPLDLSMKTTKETITNLSIPKDDPCPPGKSNNNIIVLTKNNPSQIKQLNRIISKGNSTNLTSHPKKKVSMIVTLDMLNPGLSGSKVPKPIMEQCMSEVTNSTVINSFDSGASKVCIVVNMVKIARRTQETKGNDCDVEKRDKVFFEFIYRDPVLQENWPCLGLIEKNDLAISAATPQVSNANTVSRINMSSSEDYVNSSTNSSVKTSIGSEISSQQANDLSMGASDLTSAFTAKTLLCSQKTTSESSNTTSSEKLCVGSTALFPMPQCAAIQRPSFEPCQTPPSNHNEDSHFISEPTSLPTSKYSTCSVKNSSVTYSQLKCHNSSLAKVSNEASLKLSSLSPAVHMSTQKALQDEKSTKSGFQQKNVPSSNYSEDSDFISEQISSPTSEISTQGDKTNVNLSQPMICPESSLAKVLSEVSLTSSPVNLAIPMSGGENVQDEKPTRPDLELKNLPQINAAEQTQPDATTKINPIVDNLKERVDIENTTDHVEKDEMAAQLKINECSNCHEETGSAQQNALQACQPMKSHAISKGAGIKHWSERDVISWLLENNLNQFVPIFHMVDGGKLLHLKKIQTVRPREFFERMSELDIDFLEVIKFSRFLRQLNE